MSDIMINYLSGDNRKQFTDEKGPLEKFKNEVNSNRLFTADQVNSNWYTKFSRFGIIDPGNALTGTREYIFFTKPDLHLLDGDALNPELEKVPFFKDMHKKYFNLMKQLQISTDLSSPLIPILSNALKSSIDLPEIQSNDIEGPATIYGTNIKYRGNSIKSDEDVDFSLEFTDTKNLEIYLLFKMWDMYYRNRLLGNITPVREDYTIWKTLDDQIAIYKFITAEDGESLVHYSKFYGCYPTNVPRNIFSDGGNKTDGLSFSISWKAQFVDDMDPLILNDFNILMAEAINSHTTNLPIYDSSTGTTSAKWASVPYIHAALDEGNLQKNMAYKLKWKGV